MSDQLSDDEMSNSIKAARNNLKEDESAPLSDEQLIQAATEGNMDHLTEEDLTRLEELLCIGSPNEDTFEPESKSKTRILRDINKIDSSKFSKFSGTETTTTKTTVKKSRYQKREVKKMDSTKKNMFVKRHDMKQRMIEPSTVLFVRKLKTGKTDFLTDQPDEPVKEEIEVGRIQLKEFFGIEDKDESASVARTPSVGKIDISKLKLDGSEKENMPERPAVAVGKLNASAFLQAASDEKDTKKTVQVGKLKIDSILNTDSNVNIQKQEISVGRLNPAAFLQPEAFTEEQKKEISVGKLDPSSFFIVDSNSENVEKQTPVVGKLNHAAFLQTSIDESNVAKETISVGKLNAPTFLQSDNQPISEAKPNVNVGKLGAATFLQSETEANVSKREVNVGKINPSEIMQTLHSNTSVEKEQVIVGKLNKATFLQSEADSTLPKREVNVGKINPSEIMQSLTSTSTVEKEEVIVGKLNAATFLQSEGESNVPKREVNVGKINPSEIMQSLTSTSTVEKEEVIVGKLNAATFLQSEGESNLPKREVNVGKINPSEIMQSLTSQSTSTVEKEELNVGKLNAATFLQTENESNIPKREVYVGKINPSEIMQSLTSQSTVEKQEVVVGKLTAATFLQTENESNIQRKEVNVGKINPSEILQSLTSAPTMEKQEVVNVGKLNAATFLQSDTDCNIPKREVIVGKLNPAEFLQSDAQSEVLREEVIVGKLNPSAFLQSEPSHISEKPAVNVGKLDAESFIQQNESNISKKPEVNVGKLSAADFLTQTDEKPSATVKRAESVGKIDRDKLKIKSSVSVKRTESLNVKKMNIKQVFDVDALQEHDIVETVEKPANIGKINTEGMFQPSEDTQVRQVVTTDIKKINLDGLFTKEPEPEAVQPDVGRLNTGDIEAFLKPTEVKTSQQVVDIPTHTSIKEAKQSVENKTKPSANTCAVCGKIVYETEKISMGGAFYHRACFRCRQCNNVLRLTAFCLSVSGDLYCKPHFDQLFKSHGGVYNIEATDGEVKIESTNQELIDTSDVSLPDLHDIKTRFESNTVSSEEKKSFVLIDGPQESLKDRLAALESTKADSTAKQSREEEIAHLKALRQERLKQNGHDGTVLMSGEVVKEVIGERDLPLKIEGGLSSVKDRFERGVVSDDAAAGQTRQLDESLIAAQQSRGFAVRSMFEGGDASDQAVIREAAQEDDELKACRASGKISMKAVFENGGAVDSEETGSERVEDESLLAAKQARGVNARALFEQGNFGEDTSASPQSKPHDIEVQHGAAKSLKSRFESGPSMEELEEIRRKRQEELELCKSRPAPNLMTMLFEEPANWAKVSASKFPTAKRTVYNQETTVQYETYYVDDDSEDGYSDEYEVALEETTKKSSAPSDIPTENIAKNNRAIFEQTNTTEASKPITRTGKKFVYNPADGEYCKACTKRVYQTERLETASYIFHIQCFRCKSCKSLLRNGNYAPVKEDFYCIPHYQELFKLKGNYDEGFGLQRNMPREKSSTTA